MPRVDMDMNSGRIAEWKVQEGERVTTGQTLFVIETDKSAMDIESPGSGVITEVCGELDVDIPVGQTLAWICDATDVLRNQTRSSGQNPGIDAPPGQAPLQSVAARPSVVRASPSARRLARQFEVDLGQVPGTSRRGRINKADVEGWLEQQGRGTSQCTLQGVFQDTDDAFESVPLTRMRRTIAERLQASKRDVPHFYLNADCDAGRLVVLRGQINADLQQLANATAQANRVSLNDLLIKAWALALQAVPEANVCWGGDALHRYRHSDVAVAVAVPGGLVTPVLRRVETLGLFELSRQLRALIDKARLGQLSDEHYRGGCSTLSNLGSSGVQSFTGIINPPQASLLAVGEVAERAVVREGALAVASVMSVSLSADHRSLDGAVAAELLAAFRARVEHPGVLI